MPLLPLSHSAISHAPTAGHRGPKSRLGAERRRARQPEKGAQHTRGRVMFHALPRALSMLLVLVVPVICTNNVTSPTCLSDIFADNIVGHTLIQLFSFHVLLQVQACLFLGSRSQTPESVSLKRRNYCRRTKSIDITSWERASPQRRQPGWQNGNASPSYVNSTRGRGEDCGFESRVGFKLLLLFWPAFLRRFQPNHQLSTRSF